MPILESVLNQALGLSSSQRALLAESLIASLDVPLHEEVENAWLNLAQERLRELESGKVKPVSWDSLKQKIRAT